MANKSVLIVLKNRSDFLKILKSGQRVRPCEWLVINFLKNDRSEIRWGWTLPRKVGSAVIRNRLKRLARQYLRERPLLSQADVNQGLDLNLVFRKTDNDFYKKLNYEEFSKVMDKGWSVVQKRVAH